MIATDGPRALVKSRQRVADHGEVFTPSWLVNDMLDLVVDDTRRIESRFLEPACGDGNFLVPVLERKLAVVAQRYRKCQFECRHNALLALMSLYGIEILGDNAADCRSNLLATFVKTLDLTSDPISEEDSVWLDAARAVLQANIVHGDALEMTTHSGRPITFPEWAYLGKGQYQRRDFEFENLTHTSAFGADTLFADMGKHEIFRPTRTYQPMTVAEIAGQPQ